MAYIQVEASVRTHRKFLQAGPAASWLWLCGMGYCQDGLTDGFIPHQALDYLGVKSPKNLKVKLVEAGLWIEVPGGWRVHDYLKHNRSADSIRHTKDRRKAGGSLGGRPVKETTNETSEVLHDDNHCENPSHLISSTTTAPTTATASATTREFHADQALRELQQRYPQNRVTSGYRTESAFVDALGSQPPKAFGQMLANLDNHKRSHEWRIKGMAPALEKWLRDGLWLRLLPEEAPVAERVSKNTSKTLSAVAEIMGEDE